MLEGEKNNLQAHTRKKNFIVNQGVEKKFHDQTTERICSAVLLNCTKARIEPLFELNRTAASVASSNNGMPTFSTPSTQKKIPAECWRAKKIICKRILEKKISL